ncbi:hypothetical protein AB0L99_32510 [Streptomyces sp. NPDC051954]|uniref:hypothetical protein n=1 Tax=unclassified Streptomyces TaxID=2593676 RepID=UPI00342E9FDB
MNRWSAERLGEELADRQLAGFGGVFAITEILDRPHPQDRSVARRLHERLLTDHSTTARVGGLARGVWTRWSG